MTRNLEKGIDEDSSGCTAVTDRAADEAYNPACWKTRPKVPARLRSQSTSARIQVKCLTLPASKVIKWIPVALQEGTITHASTINSYPGISTTFGLGEQQCEGGTPGGQNSSWPYGNKIKSHSFHHECAVLNTSVGSIETRPCDDKHQFVCIQDNQPRSLDVSAEKLSVELTSDQSPILLSRNLRELRLTCRAKLRNGTMLKEPGNYGYARLWTKNGIFLDHTYSSLHPEAVSEPNAYTHMIPSSQGRYRCGLKALPSGHIVWSNVITVVLEDFDTYRLTGHLNVTVDPGPIQFAGSSFVSFAKKHRKCFESQHAAAGVSQLELFWTNNR
ncbi:hypothetical protein MTO96_028306 [Rhipicephalus appendiculatus]